jgi:3-methyl-2-oxobutanoate hydroxymethyltransferase
VPVKPVTVPDVRAAKSRGQKVVVLTAYDYTSARLLDDADVDVLLVGDSVGMVVQGHPNPVPVSLGEMCYHVRCVARGAKRALVVGDLPFGSYQASPRQAVRSATKLLKAGAAAVKLEGGARMAEAVAAVVAAGIPVMGHVGLTPQSVHQLGGFKVQRDANQLMHDAKAVEAAGVFSMVIESVPTAAAAAVTAAVAVPTIGIGAGAGCDGQVLVFHDVFGLYPDFRPKFVKPFADLGPQVKEAAGRYAAEVRAGTFPAAEHSFQ